MQTPHNKPDFIVGFIITLLVLACLIALTDNFLPSPGIKSSTLTFFLTALTIPGWIIAARYKLDTARNTIITGSMIGLVSGGICAYLFLKNELPLLIVFNFLVPALSGAIAAWLGHKAAYRKADLLSKTEGVDPQLKKMTGIAYAAMTAWALLFVTDLVSVTSLVFVPESSLFKKNIFELWGMVLLLYIVGLPIAFIFTYFIGYPLWVFIGWINQDTRLNAVIIGLLAGFLAGSLNFFIAFNGKVTPLTLLDLGLTVLVGGIAAWVGRREAEKYPTSLAHTQKASKI